ncbi:MAG: kanamycin kinase [Tissierellia bacterium]|nr:kanamycin kinase [Tissierellia bacterium]
MDTNTFNLIKKIEFFNDKEISSILEMTKDKYKIITKSDNYTLGLYPLGSYDDIKIEEKIEEFLQISKVKVLRLYRAGILPDIDKCYKIFEYRKEISLEDYLKNNSKEDNYKLGLEFGEILKNFHNIKITDVKSNWYKSFDTKLNYVLYQLGLSEKKGDKDYIIQDFINNNRHLTRNTAVNLIHSNLNLKNIRIAKNGIDLRGLKKINTGDGTIDFLVLNEASLYSKEFSNAVMKSYFSGNIPTRKFFKLLSLYQAYYLLCNMVDIRNNRENELKREKIDKIFEMYDDFSDIIPNWYQTN